jgi:uncharacterized membrane protein YccC
MKQAGDQAEAVPMTAAAMSFVARRTAWTEGHVFAIVPEQIGLGEGLRAALAIGTMLAAALLFDVPGLAWSAVAAFWICLCDPTGRRAARRRTMLTFTAFGIVVLAGASYAAHWGPVVGGAALFVLILLCGLTRSYPATFGPAAPQPGLVASIAVVIGAATPRDFAGALALGGYFFVGAVWATLLCLYLWPIRPDTPARRALVAIYSRLAGMTRSLAALDAAPDAASEQWTRFETLDRRAARIALERGAQIVARIDARDGQFTRALDAAGHVLASLIALGRLRKTMRAFDPALERPLLVELGRLLDLAASRPDHPAQDWAMLHAGAAALLARAQGGQDRFARALQFAARPLAELGQRGTAPRLASPAGPVPAGGWPPKVTRPVWRHAVRVAAATLASYCLGRWLEVSFAYWGSIATIVVMQPLMSNTWLRVLERAAGSLVGGAIAAILLALAPSPAHIALAVVALSVACIGLRVVSYGVFVVFLTPMFMLLSDFIHPAGGLITARVVGEGLGAVIGMVACLVLWPDRQQNTLIDAMQGAIRANLAYIAAVVRGAGDPEDDLDHLHREAGLASTRAETAHERLVFEGPAGPPRLRQAGAILLAVRAACGAAIVLRITRDAPHRDAPRAATFDAAAQWMVQRLDEAPTAAAPPPRLGGDDLGDAVDALVMAVEDYASKPGA